MASILARDPGIRMTTFFQRFQDNKGLPLAAALEARELIILTLTRAASAGSPV